jgi:hypothetical protein
MQCVCGGETKDNVSMNKKLDLCWQFVECKVCHRISLDVLKNYKGDKIICSGIKSREKYREMTS